MRTRWGWALVVLGILLGAVGAVAMVLLGPDSRFTTGPHAIETDDVAVVTAPRAIRWADVQVDILAEVPVRKPLFIGVGNAVDVQDYLAKTERLEITSFKRPWTLRTRNVEGEPTLPSAPTAIDWWFESAAGLGGASLSTQLPDETVSIAILSVGSSNLTGLEVTVAYGVKGGFAKGGALVLLGAAIAWLGLLVRRGRRDGEYDDEAVDGDSTGDIDDAARRTQVAGLDEEVVYVYVDDDGAEHEISPDEAADFEVVEVVEEVVAIEEPVPDPEPEPEPEQVVYVYVDDDGVEHEVSEEELAEFEVVDEEEQP